ncbi:hypothetical protein TI39_contig278g00070 [Zymoseptoria brevis]|uniref:2EXR domain-containing protein n=1 Tax=Zymoseptoria brevis TaxID=1047168 RepID=A0A0F4H051_9PEZI|nr:hypothetical protein TI39_contig278g00070 [Zymoseptoria brevis]
MSSTPALTGSPFGLLPTELRLSIWEYAMHRETVVQLNLAEADVNSGSTLPEPSKTASSTVKDGLELNVYPSSEDVRLANNVPSTLALTQTCRQLRYEAMPIFLEANSFIAHCPIFDNSNGHGEVKSKSVEGNRKQIQGWLRSLDDEVEDWSSRVRNLTLDLGVWQICGCKSSSQALVDAMCGFSADFPSSRNRELKVKIAVQWRAICPCCERGTDDESTWPFKFEIVRGNSDAFFQAVIKTCEGKAEWILKRQGICGRTRVAWLMQLERTSARLVEFFGDLKRSDELWMGEGCSGFVEEAGSGEGDYS